jgi:hypothetical protein
MSLCTVSKRLRQQALIDSIRTAPLGLTVLSLRMGSSAWILLVNTQHEVSVLIAYISRAARIPGSSLVGLVTGLTSHVTKAGQPAVMRDITLGT